MLTDEAEARLCSSVRLTHEWLSEKPPVSEPMQPSGVISIMEKGCGQGLALGIPVFRCTEGKLVIRLRY